MTDENNSSPSSPSMREAIGPTAVRAYGKYMLVRKIAEGGMAEIFLAKQMGVEGFEKNVVIKRMLPHLSSVPDFVSMFLDEARLAASLAHPNIVQISDLGFADGCYYICMEYLAGEDFATVIRTARRRNEHTPLQVVLRVIADAAMGLHFAHEAVDPGGKPLKLVHRDVSPSNLFITYGGQVKVLDFGIAKAESRVSTTGAGVVKGKYQYMSPEQARGDVVDHRSDIFSLGVSMYEAITGVRPFARDTDLAVLKAVLGGEYEPVRVLRPDLPLELEQIVTRAMAQEAEYRYGSGLELVTDIEKFMASTTSASGAQALATFMRGFFGEERVNSKTRIESLTELSTRGVDVPGLVNPHSPKTDPGTRQSEGVTTADAEPATRSVGLPREVKQELRARNVKTLALVGLAVLVSVGLTVAVLKSGDTPAMGERPDASVVPVAAPPLVPVAVPAVVDAAVPEPVAELDAGAAVAVVDAGAAPVATPIKKPIALTAALVSKIVSQNMGRFQKCFKDFPQELPSRKGTLNVRFTIASSGRVSEVTTDLSGTRVSKCLEGLMKATVFPRHVDVEVRVPIALNYDVQ